MASIQEILARKKAAAAGLSPETKVDTSKAEDVAVKKEEVAVVATNPTPTLSENTTAKPLTFAEKLALKRQQEAALKVTALASLSSTTSEPDKAEDTAEGKVVAAQPVESVPTEEFKLVLVPAKGDTGTKEADSPKDSSKEEPEVSIEIQQAYADVKAKIDLLESLEDTVLEPAMKDLKKALMQNPNAVQLMLDTDIGKMVTALRRITKEAQIEAAAEKKPGRKPKNVVLTADQVAAVFDEL